MVLRDAACERNGRECCVILCMKRRAFSECCVRVSVVKARLVVFVAEFLARAIELVVFVTNRRTFVTVMNATKCFV